MSSHVSHRRHLVLVDDSPDVLTVFLQPMHRLAVTVSGILHAAQTTDELVAEILEKNPDIVLLDGNLAGTVRGYRIIPLLHELQPGLLCIGFSSADALKEPFLGSGAQAFVRKEISDPEDTLHRLMNVLW